MLVLHIITSTPLLFNFSCISTVFAKEVYNNCEHVVFELFNSNTYLYFPWLPIFCFSTHALVLALYRKKNTSLFFWNRGTVQCTILVLVQTRLVTFHRKNAFSMLFKVSWWHRVVLIFSVLMYLESIIKTKNFKEK